MTYADVHFVLLVWVHGGQRSARGGGRGMMVLRGRGSCGGCAEVVQRELLSKRQRARSCVISVRMPGRGAAVVGLLLQGRGLGKWWFVAMGSERCAGVRLCDWAIGRLGGWIAVACQLRQTGDDLVGSSSAGA